MALKLFIQNEMDWSRHKKCQDKDPSFFFPVREKPNPNVNEEMLQAENAKFCHASKNSDECPVRRQCLDYALKHREGGVWGGTTEKEREKILKGRARLNKSA